MNPSLVSCMPKLGSVLSSIELPLFKNLQFSFEDANESHNDPGARREGQISKLGDFCSSNVLEYLLKEHPENERGFTRTIWIEIEYKPTIYTGDINTQESALIHKCPLFTYTGILIKYLYDLKT